MEIIIFYALCFLAGVLIGGMVVVLGMCILHAGRTADDNNDDIMLGVESDVRHVINNGNRS